MSDPAEESGCTCGYLRDPSDPHSSQCIARATAPEPCPDYLNCEVSGHTATPEGWFHIARQDGALSGLRDVLPEDEADEWRLRR